MTSDGGAKLRTTIQNAKGSIVTITIDKLIVSTSASGPFLQRIATYTETITYVVYRDPVFHIPDDTIEEIYLIGAPVLRAVVAGSNSHLNKLQMENCLLDRVPPTLSNLVELEKLIIRKCALTALRLDMLVANHKLTTVDLSQNQIRQILPATATPKQKSAVETLGFEGNLLERVDMAMFAIMPDLKTLDVRGNRIVRFEATAPVTYASLIRIRISKNKISYFDTRNLTLSLLDSIYMDQNALTDIPTHWGAMPQLKYLGFEANNLERVDMSVFRTLQNLTSISLRSNKIESIRTSLPVTLSALVDLSLDSNQITSINLTGCNFPELGYILLTDNHLTAIPPLFQLFRKARMYVVSNPIKCSSMASFKNRIAEKRLYLRAAIENINDNIIAINIDKLIVSTSASGPFLQRISAYTETITYVVYRDPVFQIPDGNTIEEIYLIGAPVLRTMVVGYNSHLKKLQMGNCLLDRVPPTPSKLVELEELYITQCALTALRLDMLVANYKLTTIDLSQNQIRQILPVTATPKQKLAIEFLGFTSNLLERLDMAMFAIMPNLERLDVRGNRIVRFEATAPVTYASLIRLDIAINKISYFDTRNLSLPLLVSVFLHRNELTDIPSNWGAMPQLQYLGIEENNLKRVDMSAFRTLPNLASVYASNNKIESIRTSSPVTLPALKDLSFNNNHITSVNLTGCNFPELDYISLTSNHLTAVPSLFQLFRKARMSVLSNPIKCSNLASFKNRIAEKRLYVTVGAKQSECDTTSSIALDQSPRRIATYTETILYVVYRDPVFQIPDGNTIEEIELDGAEVLRAIVAGSNSHLKKLQLGNCLLDRIPPTLSKLVELEELYITQCALTALRLDMLVANHKLTTVDLSQNQIRQILPVTATPKQMSAIVNLVLASNLLERLDMAMFAIMPYVERLDVRGNRIVRFEATAPVTYASLIRLSIAINKISYFDARNLTLPLLMSFYIDQNELTDIPTNWGPMPQLQYLGFEDNNIKRVDVNAFRTLQNLTSVYLSSNKIESIRTSSPVALPALAILTLDHNQIVSVNFTGCYFPYFREISLSDNQLTTIPPLFQRFFNVRMSVRANPIKCSNMVSFKNRIIEERLFVTTRTEQSQCDTSSSILRTALHDVDDDVVTINIDKLIVSSNASGPFLQRIAAYTETILYVVYRDPVFYIPQGNTLKEIELNGAGVLHAIVAGSHSQLKRMQVENCLLDRVPPTLSELVELEELSIMQCALTALRLDMLVANHKLKTVDLSRNHIRQILPATAAPAQMSAIVNLVLTSNLLDRLDMAMFAIMPNLQYLDGGSNRIVRFEATAPVTYAFLSELNLVSNKISYFDTRNLTLPSITSLFLSQNALANIPTHWGAMPKLENLGLGENNIKQVDMSVFRPFRTLTGIYMDNGEIESIHTSSPVILPALSDLLLDQNKIVSVNFTGCVFRNMNYISLVDNQLTAIPPLFQLFPKVRITVLSNPIKCSSMASFKNRIVEERLYVNVGAEQSECDASSSILRKTIDTVDEWRAIGIAKLIVSSSASGPFLQRIAQFTKQIIYRVYREAVFQIPEGNAITEIEINGSGGLRTIVAGSNSALQALYVKHCLLDRLPPTLSKMMALESLSITYCALTALRLDMLTDNPRLTVVELSSNQIRLLVPATSPPKQKSAITSLYFMHNLLERLDMAMFAFMPDLETLDVRDNRIVHFEATAPVTYVALVRLLVSANKITTFDTRNVTLPDLYSIYLSDNELTDIPTRWGAIPNLQQLGFDQNNLTRVDLSVFRRFSKLTGIFLNVNKIQSIRTSSPVVLPMLRTAFFESNQITSVNFTGCDFANITTLSFISNRLTTVPPVFQRFPYVNVWLHENPIKCSSLASFKNRLAGGQLFVSTDRFESNCSTTSSIPLDQN
uniref:Uncharacterized protein n=1 Tax=Anopheles dirus TaxID=7168 RepID=A0A182NHW2_9DIPT